MEQSFLRLEAGMEPAAATERLTESGARWAIVRHALGRSVTWHAVSAADALAALESTNAPTLAGALGLGDRAATPTTGTAALDGVETVDETTIVLEGDRILAVLDAAAPVPAVFAAPARRLQRTDKRARRSSAPAVAADPVVVSADAEIDAPHRVALHEPFTLTVSLAAASGTGDVNVILDDGLAPFELDAQLFAPGFDAAPHKRGTLAVDPADLTASSLSFELTATEPTDDAKRLAAAGDVTEWQTSITVDFLRGMAHVGSVVHHLVVALTPADDDLGDAAVDDDWLADDTAARAIDLREASLPDPDLMITLSGTAPTDGIDGRYEVFLDSPHRPMPADPFVLNLGMDAASFAGQRYAQIKAMDGSGLGYRTLAGVGTQIANLLDQEFWDEVNATLATAKEAHGEIPTVLLRTSDPHVPWELAHLGDRPVDPDAPPFLAAQARVGRWIRDPQNPIDMASTVDFRVHNVAAVVGEYNPVTMKKGTWKQLPQAEAEGELLQQRFGAARLPAQVRTVDQLLARRIDPAPELMHFACHGTALPGSHALIANDGTPIPDLVFRDSDAGREERPFIFLNACRVGAAAEAANQYGGFAASFLRAGSTGFIGPLWEVDDTLAHEIARDFYDSLATVGPAEVLRRVRAKFAEPEGDADDPPATYMAYVYYGHPATMITGVRRKRR